MKDLKHASKHAAAIGLAVLFLASGSALAQGWSGAAFAPEADGTGPGSKGKVNKGGPGPHMLFKALKILADEIELSQDQRDSIKKIIVDGRDEIAPLRKKADTLRAQMQKLMHAKKLDKKKIKAKHAQIQAVNMEIADRRMEMTLDALDVLSDDQRLELFSILEECHAKKGTGQCKAMFKNMKDKQGPKGKKGPKGKQGPKANGGYPGSW